jgi:hypothetical protein
VRWMLDHGGSVHRVAAVHRRPSTTGQRSNAVSPFVADPDAQP